MSSVCDFTLVPGAIRLFVGAMKASDWQELQKLLVLADRQGFVQEALVETGIAKREQLPVVPATTNWKGYAQVNPGMMVSNRVLTLDTHKWNELDHPNGQLKTIWMTMTLGNTKTSNCCTDLGNS